MADDALTLGAARSREIYRMLDRLTPAEQVALTNWCGARSSPPLRVTSHTGLTRETWEDLMHLSAAGGVPLRTIADELERRLREK